MFQARSLDLKKSLTLGLAAAAVALLFMPKASHAMTITPPTLDLVLNPGDVVNEVVHIKNEQHIPYQIKPETQNFNAPEDENSGVPQFYPATENKTGYEMANWITFSNTAMVIQPGELVNLPITITVPKNATPGSHLGAIKLLADKPGTEPTPNAPHVGVQEGTAVLVFVRVSGDARDEMNVASFGAQSGMLSHLPANFVARLQNTGNTNQHPVGNIVIDNMFGQRVGTLTINPGPQYASVLPNTYRRFTASWVKRALKDNASEFKQEIENFGFGQYTATLLLNYGESGNMKNMTAVTQFWVFPWMAIICILIVLLLVFLLLYLGVKGYNKALIKSFEKRRQN